MEEYFPDDEVEKLESEFWNHKMVGSDMDGYTARFHELARLVPHMVTPESQRVNCYIQGLAPKIKAHVTSSQPATIQSAVEFDKRQKPLEFSVDDKVLLKVSPRKGVVRFGKRSKLSPRYVGAFEIVKRIGPVAYWLRLLKELVGVHDTFHVSNLKKCLADVNLHVPQDEVKVDDKLRLVEEPIEILDRRVKKIKRRWIPIVKVRWNSRRGQEFT
nr:putative reverse transcriptase domain-containing protein [Tanacetum cinerariifolium]